MVFDKHVVFNLGVVQELLLDEKEIRQLILNLVRNGLEAMPVGKKLTISTYMEKGEVVLAVQDEGGGSVLKCWINWARRFLPLKSTVPALVWLFATA